MDDPPTPTQSSSVVYLEFALHISLHKIFSSVAAVKPHTIRDSTGSYTLSVEELAYEGQAMTMIWRGEVMDLDKINLQ